MWREAESSKQSPLTCMNVLEHLQKKRSLEKMNCGAYPELEEMTAVSYVKRTQRFDAKQCFKAHGDVIN